MSTPSVSTIAAAIQTQLEAIPGLRTAAYLSDKISPPVALVAIETVGYHGAFAGGDVVRGGSTVILAMRDGRAAAAAIHKALQDGKPATGADAVAEPAVSESSKVEVDSTFGGVVSSGFVVDAGPPSSIQINGTATYIACPFKVEVHA